MIDEERVAKLLEHEGRRKALIDYVKKENYSIERSAIAAILGFDLEDRDDKPSERID